MSRLGTGSRLLFLVASAALSCTDTERDPPAPGAPDGGGSGDASRRDARSDAWEDAKGVDAPAECACPGEGGPDGSAPRPEAGAAADAAADAPVTPASCAAGDAGGGPLEVLELAAPAEAPPGRSFTLSVRTASGAPLSTRVRLCIDGVPGPELGLYRGRGSVPLVLPETGPVALSVHAEGAYGARRLDVVDRPFVEVTGALTASELAWSRDTDIHVLGDAIVPVGETLSVASGARIFLHDKASLEVQGTLRVTGTATDPVLFTRAGDAAWGGVRVVAGGGAEIDEAWFTGGGGDATRRFGHSNSQPVLHAAGGTLTVHGGGVVDNVGKALGAQRGTIAVDGALISRSDTGGQVTDSAVLIERAHFLELPDGDGVFGDDDNDGIYVSGFARDASGTPIEAVIRDTVFALTEDDGIDHNGPPLRIERVFVDGCRHEGVAASTGSRVLITDSFVRGCEQGIEAGYGVPTVVVERTVVTGNDVGFRYGDSYDWETTGTLTVRHSVSAGNRVANVRNHVVLLGGPAPGAVDIQCSMVSTDGFDGLDGNLPGEPTGAWATRGCSDGPTMSRAGCDGLPPGPSACF